MHDDGNGPLPHRRHDAVEIGSMSGVTRHALGGTTMRRDRLAGVLHGRRCPTDTHDVQASSGRNLCAGPVDPGAGARHDGRITHLSGAYVVGTSTRVSWVTPISQLLATWGRPWPVSTAHGRLPTKDLVGSSRSRPGPHPARDDREGRNLVFR